MSHNALIFYCRRADYMKIGEIVNLIKYHVDGDDDLFVKQSTSIADDFYENGDVDVARYIYNILSDASHIVPQSDSSTHIGVLEKMHISREPLFLPEIIKNQLIGVVNASKRHVGMSKYLFYGAPGTGKTEACHQIARILKRNLWRVNIAQLINSYLGETSKNIANLFSSINNYPFKSTMIVLFDEIDALALNRTDSRDLREMSRATTELFRGLDSLSDEVILIATTNLETDLDKALLRRFSARISFDNYSKDDLVDIGLKIYEKTIIKVPELVPNNRLVKKIFETCENLPMPGDLKNIITSSIAFSDSNSKYDYLTRLFKELHPNEEITIDTLRKKYNFSLRDIEMISKTSKSKVGREIRNG